jgi:hypothetical protein
MSSFPLLNRLGVFALKFLRIRDPAPIDPSDWKKSKGRHIVLIANLPTDVRTPAHYYDIPERLESPVIFKRAVPLRFGLALTQFFNHEQVLAGGRRWAIFVLRPRPARRWRLNTGQWKMMGRADR